jgi:hypothetical protein
VQHRERTITSRLHGNLASQQRPHRRGRPGQQFSTLAFPRSRQAPFEQLAYQPEHETRLQFRAPRTHHLMAKLTRPRAGHLNHRGLADADPALDQQHPSAALQQLLDRRHVTLALTQPAHQEPGCRFNPVPSTARSRAAGARFLPHSR